ncbi:hypothetical protein GCM10023317_26350 [Actinopolymorpha pittospori]
MRDVCTDFGAELREFNGDTDHVHLLLHYPGLAEHARPGPVGQLDAVRTQVAGR